MKDIKIVEQESAEAQKRCLIGWNADTDFWGFHLLQRSLYDKMG